MSALDLRDRVRDALAREILGGEWRADRPLEFGGLIGTLFATIKRGDDPRAVMGEIDGRIRAISALDEAMKEMN